eukprot:6195070-Pleurochrysis_carterae.AAC.1
MEISTQPQALDFRALDMYGWKRWATLSMFKGRDGVVRFTDGDSPVTCRATDGGIEVALRASAFGGTVT